MECWLNIYEEVGSNLSFVENIASIHSFEGQVLCNTSVNEYTDQSTIRHHKLAIGTRPEQTS